MNREVAYRVAMIQIPPKKVILYVEMYSVPIFWVHPVQKPLSWPLHSNARSTL